MGRFDVCNEIQSYIWNGRVKDKDVMPGLYVYVLYLTYDQETNVMSGSVTLVK